MTMRHSISFKSVRYFDLVALKGIFTLPQKSLLMAQKDLTPNPSPDDEKQGRRQERGEKPPFSVISPSPERCFFAQESGPGGEVGLASDFCAIAKKQKAP